LLAINVGKVYQGGDKLGIETKRGAVFGFRFLELLAPGFQEAEVEMRLRPIQRRSFRR
jgi:hypothetical protein